MNQAGAENESFVEQGLTNAASTGNTADVDQQAGASNAYSERAQNGDGNSASVIQSAANTENYTRVEATTTTARSPSGARKA